MQVCPTRGSLHGWLSFRCLLFTKWVLIFFLTRFEGNNKATMFVNKYIWARTILRHLSSDIMRSLNEPGPLSLHRGQMIQSAPKFIHQKPYQTSAEWCVLSRHEHFVSTKVPAETHQPVKGIHRLKEARNSVWICLKQSFKLLLLPHHTPALVCVGVGRDKIYSEIGFSVHLNLWRQPGSGLQPPSPLPPCTHCNTMISIWSGFGGSFSGWSEHQLTPLDE